MNSSLKDLEKLGELREKGLLSEEEFEFEKHEIIEEQKSSKKKEIQDPLENKITEEKTELEKKLTHPGIPSLKSTGRNIQKTDGPKGLGGWLIIVILGLIFGAIGIIEFIDSYFLTLINEGAFYSLISPSSSSYIEGAFSLIVFEFIGNIILLLFSCVLIYTFFIKYKRFPIFYKIFLISNFLFILFDYLFINSVPQIARNINMSDFYSDIIRAFLTFLIWGSYIHVSKRVKNTFTEESYKKIDNWAIAIIVIIGLLLINVFINVDYSKIFSFSEFDYGNNICISTYGEMSFFTGEVSDGSYLCDCKEGYDFGGVNDDSCVVIKNKVTDIK